PKRIMVGDGQVRAFVLSADGKTMITIGRAARPGKDDEVRIWNTERGTSEVLFGAKALVSMAWQPGGKLLAVRQYTGPIHFFYVPGRKKLDSLPVYPSRNEEFSPGIDFSSDGKLLAVAGGTYMEVYDAAALKRVDRFHTHLAGIHILTFR